MKNKTYFRLPLILAAVTALSLSCARKGPVELKLNLAEGTQKRAQITNRQQSIQDFGEEKMETDQTLKMTYLYRVKEKDKEGNHYIDITYEGIYHKLIGDFIDFKYDSEDEERENGDFFAQAYDALMGKTFSVVISSAGRIKEFSGIDSIISEITRELTVDEDLGGRMRELLKARFGKGKVRETFRKFFNIYPSGPVKSGDTWKRSSEKILGFPMSRQTEYKLRKLSGEYAQIEVQSEIASPRENEIVYDGSGYKTEFAGKEEGKIMVDVETGWIESAEITQDMEGKVTSIKESQEAVFPVRVKDKTIFETLEIEDQN
ncbi:MAG: DUF6263 family protein [Elusimicrobiota bacterium]|nr:DUF6263 family protein [Elusimicrobiota bacterium]